MGLQVCFPGGKKKAVTLSYDDGQIYDRRLVDLLDRYGLRATFHLNSGTLGTGNETDEFLRSDEIEELFEGHEIACHSVTHPYFSQLTKDQIVSEIWEDRRRLESYAGRPVRGFSYPYGEFSDETIEAAVRLGIEYARTVENTGEYHIPTDFMRWNPTCHHDKALLFVEDFLHPLPYRDLLLFYVWGHSFEFEREQTWDRMEQFCREISGHEDVWYTTNIEIKDYITAYRSLVLTVGADIVYNPTAVEVYLQTDTGLTSVKAGETKRL